MKAVRNNKKSSPKNLPQSFPPQLAQKPVFGRIIRFQADADVSDFGVTRGHVLKLAVAKSGVDVTGVTMWSGVKIRRIDVWSASSVGDVGAFVTNSIEWQSNDGPSKLITDTGNINRPAHISTSPPTKSLAGFWSQIRDSASFSDVLFYLTCSNGSIIDLHLSFVEGNGTTSTEAVVVTCTGVNSTNRGIFMNNLDGATSSLLPVSLSRVIAT